MWPRNIQYDYQSFVRFFEIGIREIALPTRAHIPHLKCTDTFLEKDFDQFDYRIANNCQVSEILGFLVKIFRIYSCFSQY